jgi:hypothetical protein
MAVAKEASEKTLETPRSTGMDFPVLIMTVAIEKGKQDTISIHKDDSPATLAQAFGKKHGLKLQLVKRIEGLIQRKKAAAGRFISNHHANTKCQTTHSTSRLLSSNTVSSLHSASLHSPSNYGDFLYSRRQRPRPLPPPDRPSSLSTRRKSNIDREERLIMQGEMKQRKLKEMRSRTLTAELRDCTFTPTVDQRSAKLDRNSGPGTGSKRIAKLHSDAYEKELRLMDTYEAAVKSEFPFRPSTVSLRKTPETQSAMIQRLLTSKTLFQEAINKLRSDLNQTVPVFKPTTGRGPSTGKRRGDVYEYLYGIRTKHEAVIREIREKRESEKEGSRVQLGKSVELAAEFRRRRIEALFAALDQDRDNQIEFETLAVQGLESRAIELLAPVWAELQERQAPAGLDWLTERVEGVLSSVSNEEKSYLLKSFSTLSQGPPPRASHSSVLSPASQSLALKRRNQLGADIYARRTTELVKTTERIKEMQARKRVEELKECSFRPKTTPYSRR